MFPLIVLACTMTSSPALLVEAAAAASSATFRPLPPSCGQVPMSQSLPPVLHMLAMLTLLSLRGELFELASFKHASAGDKLALSSSGMQVG